MSRQKDANGSGGDPPPLHELNPTGRFSDRVEDYVRFRPTYPAAAIDRMLRELPGPERLVAADIGAGTGISARLLADRGVQVLAVEPNADMRAASPPHPRITWLPGTAESTGLPTRGVNLILCAQAFHWFRPQQSLTEFSRILTRPGRLALMWNKRDKNDPLTLAYTEAIRAVSNEHQAEMMPFDPAVLPASGHFGPVTREKYPNAQPLDLAGLIGRAASASYVPKSGPGFERLVEMLTRAHQRHADEQGIVQLRYVTELYLSEAL